VSSEPVPVKLGPNTYYFRGDLWTVEELKARWGIKVEKSDATTEDLVGAARD
jgi:hypothetical protein